MQPPAVMREAVFADILLAIAMPETEQLGKGAGATGVLQGALEEGGVIAPLVQDPGQTTVLVVLQLALGHGLTQRVLPGTHGGKDPLGGAVTTGCCCQSG